MKNFKSPYEIQKFLDSLKYNPKDYARSAAKVYQDKTAHCFEGALFACWAMEQLGFEPQVVDLRAHRDDDHVICVYQVNKLWGALGKSNTSVLTWRDPIYKNIRELVMSYWPLYFNIKRQLSLYQFAGPLKLKNYEKKWDWRFGTGDLVEMGRSFNKTKGEIIISKRQLEKLPLASHRLKDSCYLGCDQSAFFKP